MNDKDSYMQFNKSHISLITIFEHKKREEKESVHFSFQAWSFKSFLSSVLVVVSVGKSKLILVFSVFFFSCLDLRSGWVRAGIVLLVPGCVALVL